MAAEVTGGKTAVTMGALWRQFLPLSLSDVTMAFGDPLQTATLAHLPDAKANLAAVGVAKTLAIFFESPIIMILHASNALAPSAAARKALWRFVLLAIGLLSGLMLLLTIPAVFAAVGGSLMGIPETLLDRSRLVLLLMAVWPAAIGWRRYFQGQLIHAGHGKAVGRASVARLAVVAALLGTGYVLGFAGAVVAGVSLAAGVVAEALLVTLAAKKLGVTKEPANETGETLPTDLKGVWRFYWPLANSMLVVWGGRAVLVAVIARAMDAPIALAAWPAAWGMVMLIGNATRMVQQVIIRNKDAAARSLLMRFAASVGLSCTLLLLAIGLTPPGAWVLASFVGPNPELFAAVQPVVVLCSPIPLLMAMQNAVQGFLISAGRTTRVNAATWMGTAVLLLGTMAGLHFGVAGASAAATAMVAALAVEAGWLALGLVDGSGDLKAPVRRQAPESTP